jgi:hypothetical protein
MAARSLVWKPGGGACRGPGRACRRRATRCPAHSGRCVLCGATVKVIVLGPWTQLARSREGTSAVHGPITTNAQAAGDLRSARSGCALSDVRGERRIAMAGVR